MKNYILKILLKHPKGRTEIENEMLVQYVGSVRRNNENWFQELSFMMRIEQLFDNQYQYEI